MLPFNTFLLYKYMPREEESDLAAKKDTVSVARYRYHNHSTERFVNAFCDNIGAVCACFQ